MCNRKRHRRKWKLIKGAENSWVWSLELDQGKVKKRQKRARRNLNFNLKSDFDNKKVPIPLKVHRNLKNAPPHDLQKLHLDLELWKNPTDLDLKTTQKPQNPYSHPPHPLIYIQDQELAFSTLIKKSLKIGTFDHISSQLTTDIIDFSFMHSD